MAAPRTRSGRIITVFSLALAGVAGVALGAFAAGAGPGASPGPSHALVAATPSVAPSPSVQPTPVPTATPEPTPTPVPTPTPSPTPAPTPKPVKAPLTGRLVSPAVARRHPIAVMVDDHWDARPQSGFNDASVVWQAPAEGGIPRYMLVFQDRVPPIGRAGPQRAPVLHRLGGRVEGGVCACRRLAAGPVDPAVAGSRSARVQRRRVPLGRRLLPPHSRPVRPAQRLHERQGAVAAGAPGRCPQRAGQGGLEVRPGPARPAPTPGRSDRCGLLAEQDHLPLRPQDQHVQAGGHRREAPDRPRAGPAGGTEERRDHGHVVRPPERREQEEPAGGPVHRAGARPGSRPTARPSRARGASAR